MALSIASTSTYDNSGANLSAVITKPSGLAVGDLMFLHLTTEASGRTLTQPGGWTISSTLSTYCTMVIGYKIADSSDVAASTFTFSFNDNGGGPQHIIGNMFRITGFNSVNPIAVSTDEVNYSGGGSKVFSNSITPATADSLLLLAIGHNSTLTGISAYAVATSSPSFTEFQDSSVSALAYGTRTAITATGNSSFTGPDQAYAVAQVVIRPNFTSSSTETITMSENKSFSLGLLIQEIITMTESLSNIKQRLWNTVTKNVSSWINPDKS